MSIQNLTHRIEDVFARPQATTLASAIRDASSDFVKASDFNEPALCEQAEKRNVVIVQSAEW
jgi:hypothetical protein